MRPTQRASTLVTLVALLAIASCSPANVVEPPGGQATLAVRADLSGTAVATVVVEVTGPGITTTLVFNLSIVSNVASGTITIPAGSNRTITMHAYDASGAETHRGSVTVNIVAGTNPSISLVLTPLTGDVPITATLGSLTVAVTPSPASVGRGLTVTLAATITSGGNPVTGTVSWATDNPGIASVTSGGVVTGVAPGQTNIVATFQGAAGASSVTVTGP